MRPTSPQIPDENTKKLRISLISEEVNKELLPALEADDIYLIADGLADALYVIFDTAISYGIPIDTIFDEVHRSNMSKDAIRKTEEENTAHKVQHGNNYRKPQIKMIIDQHKLQGGRGDI